MKSGLLGGGEYNGVGLIGISQIFATHEDLLWWQHQFTSIITCGYRPLLVLVRVGLYRQAAGP